MLPSGLKNAISNLRKQKAFNAQIWRKINREAGDVRLQEELCPIANGRRVCQGDRGWQA
jgi:hypothetical protein